MRTRSRRPARRERLRRRWTRLAVVVAAAGGSGVAHLQRHQQRPSAGSFWIARSTLLLGDLPLNRVRTKGRPLPLPPPLPLSLTLLLPLPPPRAQVTDFSEEKEMRAKVDKTQVQVGGGAAWCVGGPWCRHNRGVDVLCRQAQAEHGWARAHGLAKVCTCLT